MGKKIIKKFQAILQLQGSSPALFTMVKAKPRAVRRKEGEESWQCPDHSLITTHRYKRFPRDLTLLWKLHELNSFPCVVQHLQLLTETRARSCFQVTTSLLCSRFKRFCFVVGGGFSVCLVLCMWKDESPHLYLFLVTFGGLSLFLFCPFQCVSFCLSLFYFYPLQASLLSNKSGWVKKGGEVGKK